MPIMHVYPDGTSSPQEPADGQIFNMWDKQGNVIGIYQYDGFIGQWYDITHGVPTRSTLDIDMVNVVLELSKPLMKCECGTETDRHSTWCQKFTKY